MGSDTTTSTNATVGNSGASQGIVSGGGSSGGTVSGGVAGSSTGGSSTGNVTLADTTSTISGRSTIKSITHVSAGGVVTQYTPNENDLFFVNIYRVATPVCNASGACMQAAPVDDSKIAIKIPGCNLQTALNFNQTSEFNYTNTSAGTAITQMACAVPSTVNLDGTAATEIINFLDTIAGTTTLQIELPSNASGTKNLIFKSADNSTTTLSLVNSDYLVFE